MERSDAAILKLPIALKKTTFVLLVRFRGQERPSYNKNEMKPNETK
jgi:hypothetical protein